MAAPADSSAARQVWLFIVAPLIGAVVAVGIWQLTREIDEGPEEFEAGAERAQLA